MGAFKHRQLMGLIALLLWIASLVLPVETMCGSPHPAQGYFILTFGWVGPLGLGGADWVNPSACFAWYANLFVVWTIGRLLFNKRVQIVPAAIGLALALSALTWRTERDTPLCGFHTGFYFWISCVVLLAVVALLELTMHPKSKSEGGTP
jgi:hypothetical protein